MLFELEINVTMSHSLYNHLFTVNETCLKVNVTNLTVEIMGGALVQRFSIRAGLRKPLATVA